MTSKQKKSWRRSRKTTATIYQIRAVLKENEYDEELAVTPLANVISVVARKGEECYNVRLDKETLKIVSVDHLKYNRRRDSIRRVFRRAV